MKAMAGAAMAFVGYILRPESLPEAGAGRPAGFGARPGWGAAKAGLWIALSILGSLALGQLT